MRRPSALSLQQFTVHDAIAEDDDGIVRIWSTLEERLTLRVAPAFCRSKKGSAETGWIISSVLCQRGHEFLASHQKGKVVTTLG